MNEFYLQKRRKVELDKKPISIGNSKGFRIRQNEIFLKSYKTYHLIIIEGDKK